MENAMIYGAFGTFMLVISIVAFTKYRKLTSSEFVKVNAEIVSVISKVSGTRKGTTVFFLYPVLKFIYREKLIEVTSSYYVPKSKYDKHMPATGYDIGSKVVARIYDNDPKTVIIDGTPTEKRMLMLGFITTAITIFFFVRAISFLVQ